MKRNIKSALLVTLFLARLALAADTNCPEHFAGGKAPDLINPKLNITAREVCYSGYAIKHSGVTRTPIYSAEYLTKERLLQAKGVKRKNSFHPDENIPASERAELKHYAKSVYDRGHMAPSADMSDEQSQYESFSLANMVPQNPNNNRGAWARLESTVRQRAMERGKVYVVTGTIFDTSNPVFASGVVSVPSALFKIVYDPVANETEVYLTANKASAEPYSLSLSQLEQITELKAFPGIENRDKNIRMK